MFSVMAKPILARGAPTDCVVLPGRGSVSLHSREARGTRRCAARRSRILACIHRTLPKNVFMRRRSAAVALAACASRALAADIASIQLLTQGEFRLLSEDLGAALSYKPLIPSQALGITGCDIGLGLTGTRLKNDAILEKASSGDSVPSMLPVPTTA